jgi:putative ubiquitin-RnfH superfamily antitoxin RatB of RatAB toxin-antitoxin module
MDTADGPSEATVEVAYGTVEQQWLVTLPWFFGLTAQQAVEQSGVLDYATDVDPKALVLGRFGRQIAVSAALEAGDRIELCRPLQRDPREMRRAAVAEGGVVGKTSR